MMSFPFNMRLRTVLLVAIALMSMAFTPVTVDAVGPVLEQQPEIIDVRFNITTDASGDYTATSTQSVVGRLIAVEHSFSGLASTTDTVLSVTETTGGVDRTLLTLTNVNSNQFEDIMDVALTNAHGSSSQYGHPFVSGKLKVVVAQGGNAVSGVLVAYIESAR